MITAARETVERGVVANAFHANSEEAGPVMALDFIERVNDIF